MGIYQAPPPIDPWKPKKPDCGDHCVAIVRCTCCVVCCCWIWTCIPECNEICEEPYQRDWSRYGDGNLKRGQDYPSNFTYQFQTKKAISPDGVGFFLTLDNAGHEMTWSEKERE